MRLSTILSFACLLVRPAPLEAQERELGGWGFFSGGQGGRGNGQGGFRGGSGGGGGYGGQGGSSERFPEEDLVSISCSAEFECSCNGGDATFVCREKTCNDGTTKLKAKCINPDRARPTDVCGCCGEECPRRNKHNSFDKWDKDFYSEDEDEDDSDEDEDDSDEDQSEIFEDFPDPTASPSPKPSPEPTTVAPVSSPTSSPVPDPSPEPTKATTAPTVAATPRPSDTPVAPSASPSASPTSSPPTSSPSLTPVARPIDAVASTVMVTRNDSDEPLPPNTVTITEYLGAAVTFTVTQKWKTSDSISWIAVSYDQAAGDMFCNEADKREGVTYNEVNTYTAQCDGDTATVDLFVHDGTFSGSQINIRNCQGWGSDEKIAYYTITLSCDGSSVATTATSTFDSVLEFPQDISEVLPTTSPTLRSEAFGGTSSINQPAGVDEEIKMRRIYLGAGAAVVVLLLLAVIVKLCCCRKPRTKSVG